MENFKEKEYKVFEMFDKQWAIVTAGSMEHYNSCTIGWGSLGNIWGHAGKSCPIVTVADNSRSHAASSVYGGGCFAFMSAFLRGSCGRGSEGAGIPEGRNGRIPDIRNPLEGCRRWNPRRAFAGG